MLAFPVTRVCKVKPDRRNVPRPGFRRDHAYQMLSGFTPSGSSDIHFLVVNESGQAVVLPAEDIIVLDPLEPGYRDGINGAPVTITGSGGSTLHVSGGALSLTFDFTGQRTWVANYAWGIPTNVMAFDTSRVVMVPHRVTFDVAFNTVTVDWSRPVSGTLVLS